jgi:thiol-disulfide isomerase/thioredoxin
MGNITSKLLILFLFFGLGRIARAQTPVEVSTGIQQKLQSIRSGELHYQYRYKELFSYDTVMREVSLYFYAVGNSYAIVMSRKHFFTNLFDLHHQYNILPDSGKGWVREQEDAGKVAKWSTLYGPLFLPQLRANWIKYDDSKTYVIHDSLLNAVPVKILSMKSRFKINDSLYNGKEFEYHINVSDSIPVYSKIIEENFGDPQYDEFTLLNYRFNNYDSSAFFTMLQDSINSFYANYDIIQVDSSTKTEVPPIPKIGTIAPNFTGVSFNSQPVILHQAVNRYKVTLLDFYYNSCMPCRLSLPKLASIFNKYKDKGLLAIGINPFDTSRSSVEKTLNRFSIQYPIILDNLGQIRHSYNIAGFPTIFLLDSEGKIIFSQEGYSDNLEDRLSKLIEEELSK